ncbi:hypothetical protein ACHAXN_003823 [Cyclotella atomus]
MSSKSKEDEILSRQRDIAMIRAAKAVESKLEPSNIDKRKAPPPNKPNPVRSLSSLTGLPSKGSEKNPICIDDRSTKQPPITKRARPKTNADAILAQTRQRVSSEEDKSSEPQLKRPSVKRPSLRNQSCALAAAPHNSGSSNENTNEKKPAASQKGSLSSILLSNKVTAKYLSKDAPKLLKHYPKVEPNDYWKNLRAWDFVRDLNEKVGEGKKVSNSKDGNAAAAAGKRSRDDSKLTDVKSDSSVKDQKETKLQPVPNRFSSHREYCAIWSPLLMNETRAQLLSDAISDIPYWKSKPEKQPIRIKVEVRKKDLDGEYDTIGLVVKQVIGECTAERMFMSNDVVCLVQEEKTVWDASKGALDVDINNSSKPWCIVGHLEHTRRSMDNLVITVSRKVWKQFGCGEMTFLKVGCNITSLREFTALCRMDRLPLADYILCTKMNVEEDEESELTSGDAKDEKMAKKQILQKMGGPIALGKGFVDYAQHKFNLSQLKGISASAAEYGNGGFTLIKGPPGTGKVSAYIWILHFDIRSLTLFNAFVPNAKQTTTLCALLNALHIRQMNQYYAEVKILAESDRGVVGKQADLSLSDAFKKRPRILVCAPSNAAVDNIILKIMEDGFIGGGDGLRYNPIITRIGSGHSAAVKAVCLEDKIEEYMSDSMDVSKLESTIEGFEGERRRIHHDINRLRARMWAMTNAAKYPLSKDWEIRIEEQVDRPRVFFVNHKDKTTTYEVPPPPEPGERHFPARAMPEYKNFVAKVVKMVERCNRMNTTIDRYKLCRDLAAAASGGNVAHSHAMNDTRIRLETHILNSATLVLTTLGTAGNRALEAANKFEVVVIDEAAQSVEPSTLAGLQLGSSHAILVGDPQQLPATIFSMSGRTTKYDRSLFARLEEAGHAVHMLNTQFRMHLHGLNFLPTSLYEQHPAISDFPRRIFYDGKLMDGSNVLHPEYGNPLKKAIFKAFNAFQPFTVFDLESSEERGGTSLSNSAEAQLALHLFNNLRSGTNGLSTKSRVAIITPYAQQAALLRRTFGNGLGVDYERYVEINTVDAFQGREANIVIFSCVRAAGSKGIGFLSDVRRMNVALTRAKNFLFVIARCSSIIVNPYWRDLVDHARETKSVIEVPFSGTRQAFTFPDLSTLKASSKCPKKQNFDFAVEDSKREGSVVQLMGLKLDIPPPK